MRWEGGVWEVRAARRGAARREAHAVKSRMVGCSEAPFLAQVSEQISLTKSRLQIVFFSDITNVPFFHIAAQTSDIRI
jgi:hypothetical protein